MPAAQEDPSCPGSSTMRPDPVPLPCCTRLVRLLLTLLPTALIAVAGRICLTGASRRCGTFVRYCYGDGVLNNQLTQQKRGKQQKRAKQQRAKHSRSSSKRGGSSSTSSTKRSSNTAADTTTAPRGMRVRGIQKRGKQQKRDKQQRAKHSCSSKRDGSSTSSPKRSSTAAADTTTAFPGVVSPAGGALPIEIIATGFYSTNKQLDPNSYVGTYDSASRMYLFEDNDRLSMQQLMQLGVTVSPVQQGPRATAATSTTTTAAHMTTCTTTQMEIYQAKRLAMMARYERDRYNTNRN